MFRLCRAAFTLFIFIVSFAANAANLTPTVSITSPATGATFTAPATITLNAAASDTDGTIASVKFYNGTTLLSTEKKAPYSYIWKKVAAGSYSITAQATDDNGAVTTSSAITVTVSAANTPPTVSIINPINGSSFPTTGGTITFTADARDSDGAVVKVEFYNGAILLGVANAVPFTIQLPSLAAGDYNLTALATDNLGAITISTIVSISIYSQPTISIASPATGTIFATVPANIPFTVNATHPGGTITKVEYYNGSVLIGTATTAPYSFTWTSVPNGGYLIRAKVTDNLGVTTASTPIKVIVGDGETITYLHNDFAGSPLAATDTAGNIVWKENYRPFGERITNEAESFNNRQWFHGKVADEDTGLQYFGARYYDPVLGRFMGVDPVGFQEDNIHSFNKYAYGNNNPYRYIDKDGKYADLIIEAVSLTVGFKSLIDNARAGNYSGAFVDAGGIAADLIGAAIPGVPGVAGLGIKASREAAEGVAKKVDVGSPTAGKPVDSGTRERILARDQNPDGSWTCATCGQKTANPANIHTGHIKARSHGGDLSPGNLRCEGAACNLSQGNRSAPSPGMTCAARGSCGAPYGRSD